MSKTKNYTVEVKVKEVYCVELTQEDIDEYRKENFSNAPEVTDLQIAKELASYDYQDLGYTTDSEVEIL